MISGKEPVNDIDGLNSVIITGGEPIQGKHGFGIIVGNGSQRRKLSIKGFLLCQGSRDLIIVQQFPLPGNKINFSGIDFSDVYGVSPSEKFQINYIFYREAEIIVLPGDQMPPQSQVNNVQLSVLLQELFPYHIKAFSRIENIRLN